MILIVQVVGLSAPLAIGDQECQSLRLRDFKYGDAVTTLPCEDPALLDRARESLNKGAWLAAYGVFERPSPRARGAAATPQLRLCKLGPLPRPSALYGMTPEESLEAEALINRLLAEANAAAVTEAAAGEPAEPPPRKSVPLLDYIMNELFALTQTSTAGLSARYLAAVRMTVLQALSYGMVPKDTNPRISMGTFGVPGLGKKKLAQYACLLAPVGDTVQPAVCSVPGLSAQIQQKTGGWSVTPGTLPNTSGGVCVVEDLHRINKKDLNAVQSLFSAVAEDAKIAPRKAASASYECRTALHLNANRQSILEARCTLGDPQARARDMMIPFDLFTRLDSLLDMSSGDDASLAAEEMIVQAPPEEAPYDCSLHSGRQESAREAAEQQEAQRKRSLQVLIGRLLDRAPSVSLREVEEEARQLARDLALVAREHTAKVAGPQAEIFNADSLLRRMTNSARKFIGASARLGGRTVANRDDIACAWEMLNYKLEAVKWLCGEAARIRPLGSRERQVKKALRKKDKRFGQIVESFGGCEGVTPEQIAEALGFTVRTIQQELRERGIFPRGGRYDVPTTEGYEELRARQAAGEAEDEGDEADDEEPDDLDDDEEPEERGPIVWNDGLPVVPEILAPFQEGLDQMVAAAADEEPREEEFEDETAARVEKAKEEAKRASIHLGNLIFREKGTVGGAAYTVNALLQVVQSGTWELECGMEVSGEVMAAVRAELGHADWTTRAKMALMLYVESQFADQQFEWTIERLLEEDPRLPEGLKDALRAALKRLEYYRLQDEILQTQAALADAS